MKKSITIFLILHLSVSIFAQGLWTVKSTSPANLEGSVSFTIGSTGYVYSGGDSANFYAYDYTTDTWSALADFPGGLRYGAVGFSAGGFGYVGMGEPNFNDPQPSFYKYDPTGNSWSAIANYPDSVTGAFSFTLGGAGYVAGGDRGVSGNTAACYSYNAGTNQWIAKASMPLALAYGFSAVTGGRAFCGFGVMGGTLHRDTVLEYDATLDAWAFRANRSMSTLNTFPFMNAFAIGNNIYVADAKGMGTHGAMQVYDIVADSWSTIHVFPYRSQASCEPLRSFAAFSFAGKGYLGALNYCDTTNFWEFDPGNSFTITSFTGDTVCEYDLVSVTVASTVSFGGSNEFTLHLNGTEGVPDRGISAPVAGTSSGTYTFRVPNTIWSDWQAGVELSVFSSDPPLETEWFNQTLVVKKAPVSGPFASTYTACGGSTLVLYRDNNPITLYSWTSDPVGVTGNTYNLSFEPTQDVTIFSNETFLFSGCTVLDTTFVDYVVQPALNITDSSFEVCNGGSVTIGGTATSGASYLWTSGVADSTAVNPTVSPSATTTYNVVITDPVTGCDVEGNTLVTIVEPVEQGICFVTVDSASTHNIIIWEKAGLGATDSFHLFREISTNNYQEVAAIHRDSLSEYHDYGANPNATGYRYKISASDSCGNASGLSHYHQTIHVQYLGGGNLQWNVYEIEAETTPVTSFDVYRDSLGNGNWSLMLNVPGTQTTATDVNFSQHPNARYRVAANWAYTCTPSRSGSASVFSNIIQLTPVGVEAISGRFDVQLYPNPATSELIINCGSLQVEAIRILSADGKLMMAIHNAPTQKSFDVSHLSEGVYMAEITTMEGTVTKRWVKM